MSHCPENCFYRLGLVIGQMWIVQLNPLNYTRSSPISVFSLVNEEQRSKLFSARLTPRLSVWKRDIPWSTTLVVHLGYQIFMWLWMHWLSMGTCSLFCFRDFNAQSWQNIYSEFLLVFRRKVYIIMLVSLKNNTSVL